MPHVRRESKLNRYQDCPVRMAYPGRRTRIVTRILEGLLLCLLAFMSSVMGIPFQLGAASAVQTGTDPSPRTEPFVNLHPQSVGAVPVPDLRLPHSVVSSIDRLNNAGG